MFQSCAKPWGTPGLRNGKRLSAARHGVPMHLLDIVILNIRGPDKPAGVLMSFCSDLKSPVTTSSKSSCL